MSTRQIEQVKTASLARLSDKQDSHRLDPLGVFFVILSTLGFSTLTIFGKLAYAHQLHPLTALSWRLGGGAIVLWIGLLLTQQWRLPWRMALAALGLGALGYALQSVLLFTALNHASAGITAVLFFTYPTFVALLSGICYRQRLGGRRCIALGLALAGCLLTVDWHSAVASPLGIALGIASGASYGLYLLLSARLVRNIPPLIAAGYLLLGATVTIVGWAAVTNALQWPQSLGAITAVSGLAILATAFPMACLFIGLKRLDVLPAAILSTLEPLLAMGMAILWLGEVLGTHQLLGGVLIIGSSVLVQMHPHRVKG